MEELSDSPNQYSSPSRGHYDASFNVEDFGRHEPPFESRATDPVAGHPSGARNISAFSTRSQPLRHLKPFSEVAVSRTARISQGEARRYSSLSRITLAQRLLDKLRRQTELKRSGNSRASLWWKNHHGLLADAGCLALANQDACCPRGVPVGTESDSASDN